MFCDPFPQLLPGRLVGSQKQWQDAVRTTTTDNGDSYGSPVLFQRSHCQLDPGGIAMAAALQRRK
jgi:hypothetical protein